MKRTPAFVAALVALAAALALGTTALLLAPTAPRRRRGGCRGGTRGLVRRPVRRGGDDRRVGARRRLRGGRVGSAAVGALAEKPELFGRLLIFVGLAEGIAIYGLIVSILILNRLA